MSWSLAAPAMLWGLVGVAIPIVIHLLNRRRVEVIDWGAMQFLELGRRARRKFRITEWLLLLARMGLLALVALAVARPSWRPRGAVAAASGGGPRDTVLIIDGSLSMDRRAGGTTPRALALQWARRFAGGMEPGDAVAVLVAGDRVRPVVGSPSFDKVKVLDALRAIPEPRGSSDLAPAIAEALRIVENARNPGRDIIILGDGQRRAWRPGEAGRWRLIKEIYRGMSVKPRLWAIAFNAGAKAEGADGSVAPLELARGLAPPGLPVRLATTIRNAGPAPLTRTAELQIDGKGVAGTAQVVGPIPPGGEAPLEFRAVVTEPGSHLIAVRLDPGDDPLPANDEAARPIEVAEALPALLVDGKAGTSPIGGATGFLRAALAPSGDETPAVHPTVVEASAFQGADLDGQRVLVLADVERLGPAEASAVADFLGAGGGVLVVPGDRIDEDFYNIDLFQNGNGWLPAAVGPRKGDPGRTEAIAHPAPRSFAGPVMGPFGSGESPPFGGADLFAYRVLEPARRPAGAVAARLDTGDPWVVERPFRKGRVAILAGPVDAAGGTLPVNPDFVPWVHELIFQLADPGAGARPIRPGEPIALELPEGLLKDVKDVLIRLPDGSEARSTVERSGGKARVRVAEAAEPGIYRVILPGGVRHVQVEGDGRESDPEPLARAEQGRLAEGWPLTFEGDPDRLASRVGAAGSSGPRPLWRMLVLAALGGLCLEVWLTRRLVRGRGIAGAESEGDAG